MALRLLRYLKDEQRLQTLDEVLDLEFDALASQYVHYRQAVDDTHAGARRPPES